MFTLFLLHVVDWHCFKKSTLSLHVVQYNCFQTFALSLIKTKQNRQGLLLGFSGEVVGTVAVGPCVSGGSAVGSVSVSPGSSVWGGVVGSSGSGVSVGGAVAVGGFLQGNSAKQTPMHWS